MKRKDRREHISHSFDTYCKKITKSETRDCQRFAKRRSTREVLLSDLSDHDVARLATVDKYFANEYAFSILGESVGVSDAGLAEALRGLPADRRDIVLMSYFIDMTDKEIAKLLSTARRTVAYRRAAALRELKRHMESED
jgi:DNA-directed RNA polymerase specialized sigma24 family protein